MYFLYLKVNDVSYKEDIILALQSVGIAKASYIESHNLEAALSDEFTLFTGFFKSSTGREGEQLIITALIDELEQARKMLANLRAAGIDIDGEDILNLLVLPVRMAFASSFGLKEFPAQP
jgi:hypothetical protein